MATILVYNNDENAVERYSRTLSDPMPYNVGGTLTVGEFLGSNEFGWTDTDTMRAWNDFRTYHGRGVRVDIAFVRMSQVTPSAGQGGGRYSVAQIAPQHLIGTAFAVGSNLSNQRRRELHTSAENSEAFSVVAPYEESADSIHFDKRYQPSNTFNSLGLPTLANGSRGNHVMTVQDILNQAGYDAGAVDGIFGRNTEQALRRFQRDRWLTENGIVGAMEWESLLNLNGAIV